MLCVEYGQQFLQSSKMTDIMRLKICNKFCINLEKIAPTNNEMLSKAFRDETIRINLIGQSLVEILKCCYSCRVLNTE